MKNYILTLVSALLCLCSLSCSQSEDTSLFYEDQEQTIMGYMESYSDDYSSFITVLQGAGLSELFRVYGTYTIFAFTNDAWSTYLEKCEKSSVSDFSKEELYDIVMCHVINTAGIKSSSFANGNLDQMSVMKENIIISYGGGNVIYVNGFDLVERDIELLNGVLYQIGGVIEPNDKTINEIVDLRDDMSIMQEAIKATGLDATLDMEVDQSGYATDYTLLICPDAVYNGAGINNYADLKAQICGDNVAAESSEESPMYQYVARHIIADEVYQNRFETGLYQTVGSLFLDIEVGIDFVINPDAVAPTSIELNGGNISATNGVCHILTSMLDLSPIAPKPVYYDFADQPEFDEWKLQNAGSWGTESEEFVYNGTMANVETNSLQFTYYHSPGGAYNDLHNQDGMMAKTGNWYMNYTFNSVPDGEYELWLHVLKANNSGAVLQGYWNGQKVGKVFGTKPGGDRTVGGVAVDKWGVAGANLKFYCVIPGKYNVMGLYLGNVTVKGESVFGLKTVVDGLGLVDRLEFVPIVATEEE